MMAVCHYECSEESTTHHTCHSEALAEESISISSSWAEWNEAWGSIGLLPSICSVDFSHSFEMTSQHRRFFISLRSIQNDVRQKILSPSDSSFKKEQRISLFLKRGDHVVVGDFKKSPSLETESLISLPC